MNPEQAAARPFAGRVAAPLAWSLCVLTLAAVAGAFWLAALNRYDPRLVTYVLGSALGGPVGALVASRRPENVVGWLAIAGSLSWALLEFTRQYAIYGLLTEPGSLPFARAAAWPPNWLASVGLMLVFCFVPLYFPDGRLPSRRWQPVAVFAVFVCAVLSLFLAFTPVNVEISGVSNPLGIEGLRPLVGALGVIAPVLWLGTSMASAASQVVRFRRSRGVERQQVKWFAYAAALAIFFAVVVTVSDKVLGPYAVLNEAFSAVLLPFVFGGLWLAIAVAILRYRLYDIDLVINRTLVYATLTASVVCVYVLVVGYLGNLFRAEDNLLVSLFATGIVAVIFAPLRDRLQRAANRLMYGERDEPYAVLSRLGQRLEGTLAPGAVLPAIVDTVAGALKAPHAAISLKIEDRFETAAEHGTRTGAPLVLPLVYNNETVGRLEVSPRAKGEPYAPADRRLLEDLARQAGVAAHAVRLTADLQRSRERLVTAREEERRRLRRDLHDGVGPRLAALTLKIETARNRLSHDPAADYLLSDLAGRAHEAVADVRRSVHALRPPVLDELGLIPALRETAAQYGGDNLRVSVRAPETLPPLPAAVEVAAYRIAQEAMTNVVRHAGARRCTVGLDLDAGGVLRLEVKDDGRGMDGGRGVGVGLSSMRERAEELGGTLVVEAAPAGGTVVRAELPWSSGREA
ncbi:MAG: ATP-binding region, ATPase-like [uncultured Rubrobacteraceae bacterium]|uniref:Oxygen sensor histidine kinase NreB n=1 Tax=uncultured Rubrobacteraceae bacterium TaxID=349277 RepID=A0A6J4SD87_9ACTN|nr:MAG: ATP-binding region, ATPase-like [uncultured Rubrobacteraceae bacterium]